MTSFFVSKTDEIGRKVVTFLHLKKVASSFGFLFLDSVERHGQLVPKKIFPLQKNGLLSKWSQIKDVVRLAETYKPDSSDILNTVLKLMESLVDCHELPNYQFIIAQLKLLLTKVNGRRFDSTILVFAIQLHNISPSAYKMIRNSGSIILPSLKLIRNVLSKSVQDENLKELFSKLKREQTLVNIMFEEVKLTATLRYSGGHILGYAVNNQEILATHAMVVETACHYGGPRYILRVIPCAKLSSDDLKKFIIKSLQTVGNSGGTIISVICDNCRTNLSVFCKLGG